MVFPPFPLIILIIMYQWPVSIAERSKTCTVYDRLNIGIKGSNPAWGMDVCPHVSVLFCPVSVEVLRRADPPGTCRSRSPLGVGQRSAKDSKCLFKKMYQ
jgi:hypothetical protein